MPLFNFVVPNLTYVKLISSFSNSMKLDQAHSLGLVAVCSVFALRI